MSKNAIREVRNRARAKDRMQAQFAEARKKALQAVEDEIKPLYVEGQETVDFRFDAFSCWGINVPDGAGREVFVFLREHDLHTDDWNRGVFSLAKEQAVQLGKLVEEWNADWEYQIARRYDVEQNDYYNAYAISFGPASGREHIISVRTPNGHYNDSWQWNG